MSGKNPRIAVDDGHTNGDRPPIIHLRLRLHLLLIIPILYACTHIPNVENGVNIVSQTPTLLTLPSATPPLPQTTILHTSFPTVFPTLTPLPTLSSVLADEIFRKWLLGTTDCVMPCWGGVEPGKTGWNEARNILNAVLRVYPSADTICRFGKCSASDWDYSLEDGTQFGGILFGKDDVLYSIYLDGAYTSEMDLRRLFGTSGQPVEIFVRATGAVVGDPPVFEVAILYPKFIVRYLWFAEVNNNNIVACGQPDLFFLGIAAIDENQWTAEEIDANGNQSTYSGSGRGFESLSDVTDFTVEDFFKKVMQNNSEICLRTPSKYWP
jgi:hypothetical protein